MEIIAKVENEIITNIDVNNESLYLKSLNPSLKNINNQDLLNFAKDSAIKEVIKKIELQKNHFFLLLLLLAQLRKLKS